MMKNTNPAVSKDDAINMSHDDSHDVNNSIELHDISVNTISKTVAKPNGVQIPNQKDLVKNGPRPENNVNKSPTKTFDPSRRQSVAAPIENMETEEDEKKKLAS
jgi:hypothetical protein